MENSRIWLCNGTELCNVAGFSVESSYDPEEISCYGGKASLDYIAASWRTPESGVSNREESTGFIEDFKQWVAEMPLDKRVSWAVGGMVLTAGLLFASKRKSKNRRQKQTAIQRTARRLGTHRHSATRT